MADSETRSRLVIERDVAMSLRDGTRLYADIYHPAEGKHPALLQRTPYGKETLIGTQVLLNTVRAARAGFAVVIQDVRGRGRSEGEFVPFANEATDGFDAVEWVASQEWCDGGVGMYGSSYMAATQLQAALEQPPSLRAICPVQGSSDYYEGRSYRGGVFEVGSLVSIALYAMGAGTLARLDLPREERRALWNEACELLSDLPATIRRLQHGLLRDSALSKLAPFFFDWLDHPEPDSFWSDIAIAGKYSRISVPGLHISSWYDQFLTGTLANYVGIRAAASSEAVRDAQYLLIGPWSHYPARTSLAGSIRIGDLDFGLSAIPDLDAIQLAWFAMWLKGDNRSWGSRARVQLFVMGANHWRDEEAWPLERTSTVQLYLQSGKGNDPTTGILSHDCPEADGSDSFDFISHDPAPTVGGAHLLLESAYPHGPRDQRPVESRSDVLLYTGPMLSDELEVTGAVGATVWVRTPSAGIPIVVRMTDVHPDGRSFTVCEGIRRIDSEPGDVGPVTVDLGATCHVFGPGHRVRLAVTASNFPRYPAYGSFGDPPVRLEVFHGSATPSALYLPGVT